MNNSKFVLIDICGTLFKSNTTFDFLEYFFRGNNRCLKYILLRKSFFWKGLNRLIFSLLNIDMTRNFAVSFLKGFSRKDLLVAADKFYEDVLRNKENKNVLSYIKELDEDNCKFILVSATLDFLAETIAKKLEINEFYSSLLAYDENLVCLGKIEKDLLGNKVTALKEQRRKPPYYVCITDNFTDMELLKSSIHKVIVVRNNNNNKWEKKFPQTALITYIYT